MQDGLVVPEEPSSRARWYDRLNSKIRTDEKGAL